MLNKLLLLDVYEGLRSWNKILNSSCSRSVSKMVVKEADDDDDDGLKCSYCVVISVKINKAVAGLQSYSEW